MWQCRKCMKPVFFAERKQSIGFDWHPNCLRCEECGKCLNPGQHAEHKGVPYCHHPCYGALFGPQLFGHGTRNECHTSFGKIENRDKQIKRPILEAKIKKYNTFYDGKPGELKVREANGRLIMEGVLRIYWGVNHTIHLKEEDDSRMIATRRSSHVASKIISSRLKRKKEGEGTKARFRFSLDSPRLQDFNNSDHRSYTISTYFNNLLKNDLSDTENCDNIDNKTDDFDNIDNNLDNSIDCNEDYRNSQDDNAENTKLEHTLTDDLSQINSKENKDSNSYDNSLDSDLSLAKFDDASSVPQDVDVDSKDKNGKLSEHYEKVPLRRNRALKNKTRLKRQCSINGHYYLRETSSFTPPYGSPCSIWITSKTTAEEVLNMLLEKYKVEMSTHNFALYVVKDTGELRRVQDEESPLLTRVMLGPHEDVAKVFIMDAQRTQEISHEVAQFVNLTLAECRAILQKYEQEEMKQIKMVKKKYADMRVIMQNKIQNLTCKTNELTNK